MSAQPTMTSVERIRSEFAFKRVSGWGGAAKDAASEVQGFPVLLRAQGVAATLAMLGKAPQGETKRGSPLAHDLVAWLCEGWPYGPAAIRGKSGGVAAFMGPFTSLSAAEARVVEAEALRFAVVLKLYASVLSPGVP